jgi:hypothetical protein
MIIRSDGQKHFSVAVIGGGPAGMMAAGRAASPGAKVVIIDKNRNLGRKLLLTGKGRCNITQAEFNNREFIKKLGKNGQFLFSALAAFGPKKVIDFFEQRNLLTKIERGRRVFPVSDKAQDVLKTLIRYLRENKVKIMTDSKVLGFEIKAGQIDCVKLKNEKIYANNFILAVGGLAYPGTGSTGDGYVWARKMGHKIIKPFPSLAPARIKEDWVKDLQGLSLKNVALSVWQDNKKQDLKFGEMLFTHFGISGPIVLDLSKTIGGLLAKGEVKIEIDLKPALDFPVLDKRLRRDFIKNSNKDFKNYLPELLPQKLIEPAIKLSGINADKKLNSITKDERKKLVNLLKGLKFTVGGLLGYKQAIVTGGGVDLKEVDSKTMQSKIVNNLFFAGEILDIDGPTGGYNLQICWSTGYAAGAAAALKG